MLIKVISFALGAAMINLLPQLWPKQILYVLGSLSALILFWHPSPWFKGVASLLLGIVWAQYAAWRLPGLDPLFYQKRIELELNGTIASIPEVTPRRQRFIFNSDRGLFYLDWYGHFKTLKPGEYWHLKVRLTPVQAYKNEGGWDQARWLLLKAVHAKGYVLLDKKNKMILDTQYKKYPLLRYRFEMQTKLEKKKFHIGLLSQD